MKSTFTHICVKLITKEIKKNIHAIYLEMYDGDRKS